MFCRLAIPVLAVAGLLVVLIPPPAASSQSVPTVSPTSVATITTAATVAASPASPTPEASPSPVASLTSVAVEVTVAPTGTPVPTGVASLTAVATGMASATTTVTTVTAMATAATTSPPGTVVGFFTGVDAPHGMHDPARTGPAGLTVRPQAFPTNTNPESSGSVRSRFANVIGQPIDSIVGGYGHACALTTSGTAYCWGYNSGGAVGDGTQTDRASPVAVTAGMTFGAIVAGHYHTCALTLTKEAYCWGSNGSGQVGSGTDGSSGAWAITVPTAVSGNLKFASLADGSNHTCGLTTSGMAYCWGSNSNGQLGDGTSTNRSAPVAVGGNRTFASIAAGLRHTCATTASGAAYCWGLNWDGQLGDGTSGTDRNWPLEVTGGQVFTRLAAGYNHTCGIVSGGAAYCWGQGIVLGDGFNNGYRPPVTAPVAVSGSQSFNSIVAGQYHTCGVTPSNTTYCWGYNIDGQLGDGSTDPFRTTPVAVIGGYAFTKLGAGSYFTCGITANGLTYCWGDNWYGQLGDGTIGTQPTPVAVTGTVVFGSLVSGQHHTCGLTLAGAAYCWGSNSNRQLGDGSTTNQANPSPVSGSVVFASISAGSGFTCGLDRSGLAYCWGAAGPGNDSRVPTAVSGGKTFTTFSAGGSHACGLTSGGTAYCVGGNWNGQIGDGTTNWALSPVAVSVSKSFTGLATGDSHTCGITSDGSAYCWGSNQYGQLGDGTTTSRTTPVAVSTSVRFASLVADWGNTCGLTVSGSAYCWGNNWWGQIGNGNNGSESLNPVAVTGSKVFTSLSMGYDVTCGLVSDGTPYCWGSIPSGDVNSPTVVPGNLKFSAMAGGNSHMCGVTTTGTGYCWGAKQFGQLGGGSFGYRATPGPISGQLVPGSAPPLALTTGWNHVAIGTYQASALTATDLCTSLNTANGSSTMVEINRWVNGGWDAHICGLPPNNFTLDRYTGYFVKLTRNAIWTPPA